MVDRRSRAGLDLKWNPIVLALGQVVFSAVLDIESYVPALQEQLRRAGYPRFKRLDTQSVRIDGPAGQIHTQTESRWLFLTKDEDRSISVGTNSVVVEQNHYSTFDDFSEEFGSVLEIVQSVIQTALYERIGFRRVNLIETQPGEIGLDELLHPGVLGIDSDALGANDSHRYEFWANTEIGRLMVRALRPAPEGVLPPELASSQLTIRRPSELTGAATLDIDHFGMQSGDFSVDEIIDGLWALHDTSDSAFRNSVTPKAIDIWERGSET